MVSSRISQQHAVARDHPDAVRVNSLSNVIMEERLILQIVGSCFSRRPEYSTVRYTRWCNTLTPSQLYTQVYSLIQWNL